jgi:hypothetical protein
MFGDRERQILRELRQLHRFESLLQASFESLSGATKEARVSFLVSLAEWRARAQRLDQLLDVGLSLDVTSSIRPLSGGVSTRMRHAA